ncbi:hypothetical protein, partial [uncultured Duncaniella sp.]|uniref:hypothetical protein n=1 Tax=uncultured Duncaniella sp. TaxID=2768039 RepID=UPI0026156333
KELNKGRFLIRGYTYKDILRFEYIEVYPILKYILIKGAVRGGVVGDGWSGQKRVVGRRP